MSGWELPGSHSPLPAELFLVPSAQLSPTHFVPGQLAGPQLLIPPS